jgi:hypothetical protein
MDDFDDTGDFDGGGGDAALDWRNDADLEAFARRARKNGSSLPQAMRDWEDVENRIRRGPARGLTYLAMRMGLGPHHLFAAAFTAAFLAFLALARECVWRMLRRAAWLLADVSHLFYAPTEPNKLAGLGMLFVRAADGVLPKEAE